MIWNLQPPAKSSFICRSINGTLCTLFLDFSFSLLVGNINDTYMINSGVIGQCINAMGVRRLKWCNRVLSGTYLVHGSCYVLCAWYLIAMTRNKACNCESMHSWFPNFGISTPCGFLNLYCVKQTIFMLSNKSYFYGRYTYTTHPASLLLDVNVTVSPPCNRIGWPN